MKNRVPMLAAAALLLPPLPAAFHAYAQGEAGQVQPPPAAATAIPANPEPVPIILACRAVRNDIGMYEPLRFMSVAIDMAKKTVKIVHEGDGKIFEFSDGGGGKGNFVKITGNSVVYGQQGRETWRIDRYTGTMTSSAFTIQFECQLRPSERKF